MMQKDLKYKLLPWAWFLVGFLFPIAVTLILNLGIIFNLPNFLEVLPLLTGHLFAVAHNILAADIVIGIATVFVVFFAFLQIGYSLRHIPTSLIKRYLLHYRTTMALLGLMFSLLLVSGYFAAQPEMRYVNLYLVILFIPFSVSVLIRYFYWFTHAITLEGMIDIILGCVRFQRIKQFGEELEKGALEFQNHLANRNNNIKITQLQDFSFLVFGDTFLVQSNERGFVKGINVNKLDSIMSGMKDDIEAVELGISIGSLFPQDHLTLMKLSPRVKKEKKEQTANEAVVNRVEMFRKQHMNELRDCILLDGDTLELFKQPFRDILEVYENVSHESARDVQAVSDKLVAFFDDTRWHTNVAHSEVSSSVVGHLLRFFISEMEAIADRGMNDAQLNAMIPLVYAVRNHATRQSDISLFISLLELMQRLFSRMLTQGERYNSRIATYLLYLKEICFSGGLADRVERESAEEFQKSWRIFYSPLVNKAIRTAVNTIYLLLNHSFTKTEGETRIYLFSNAERVFGILDRVANWPHITREQVHQVNDKLGRELMYLSIYMFRRCYYQNRLAAELVNSIGLRLGALAFESDRLPGSDDGDGSDKLVFDYTFQYDASFTSFEDPELETSATGTGGVPQFSHYWVVMSIFRRQQGKRFLPATIPAGTSSPDFVLGELLAATISLNVEKAVSILRIEQDKVMEELAAFRHHLESLNDRARRSLNP